MPIDFLAKEKTECLSRLKGTTGNPSILSTDDSNISPVDLFYLFWRYNRYRREGSTYSSPTTPKRPPKKGHVFLSRWLFREAFFLRWGYVEKNMVPGRRRKSLPQRYHFFVAQNKLTDTAVRRNFFSPNGWAEAEHKGNLSIPTFCFSDGFRVEGIKKKAANQIHLPVVFPCFGTCWHVKKKWRCWNYHPDPSKKSEEQLFMLFRHLDFGHFFDFQKKLESFWDSCVICSKHRLP